MFKKILAMSLVIIMAVGIAFAFTGCNSSDGNYPVTIGHVTFKSQPEKVAVLSDNVADIIYYMGYSTQICAISDSCTQEKLVQYIDSVGSETNPDAQAIINSGAECVLVDTALPEATVTTLADNDIDVITIMTPSTTAEVSTVYSSLGAMLEGKIDGKQNGTASYDRLINALESAEKEVATTTIAKGICYLYLDEEGNLCTFTNDSDGGLILEYVGATNISAKALSEKISENEGGENTLRIANPEYIFYDNQEVLNYIKSNATLDELSAVKNNKTYEIPKNEVQRHGATMLETQKFILSKLYPSSFSVTDEPAQSLEEIYGITITDNMSFEIGNQSEDIKAVQQRLVDLGYLKFENPTDSVTDHYGSKTSDAVKTFQEKNGLDATGVADSATLKVLFSAEALSIDGNTFVPEQSATTENTPTDTNTSASSYDIDTTVYRAYKQNDTHPDIVVIQQRLVDLGYLKLEAGDTTTDYFGGKTAQAVSDFQTKNGLTATGEADFNTIKVMFSDEAKSN